MTNREQIVNFLNQFPDDATNWSQATDEIRDMARGAKEHYNEYDLGLTKEEFETKGEKALDFRHLSPSQWNTLGKKYILEVFDKMSEKTKLKYHKNFKSWLVTK